MGRSLSVVLLGFMVSGSALTLPMVERRAFAAALTQTEIDDGNKALRLYKEGRNEEAAKVFESLSVAHPEMPVFVRNVGACYYYLRRTDTALSYLREYLLRKKDIGPDDRAEVERWIAELEQMRQAAPPTAPPAAPPSPQAPEPAALPTAKSPLAPLATPAPTSDAGLLPRTAPALNPGDQDQILARQTFDARPTTSSNAAAWVVGGVGVALLATGGVFSYLSHSAFSETERRYNSSKEASGKTYAYLAAGSYGLGGAALVASGIMFWATGGGTSSHSAALAPVFSPDTVGVVIHYEY